MTVAEPSPAALLIDGSLVAARIELNITDAARLCGVTSRQLNYWTNKGYVTATAERPRRYSLDALSTARQIKLRLDEGASLERAVRQIQQARAAEAETAGDALRGIVEAHLTALIDQLRRARPGVELDILHNRLRRRLARLAEPAVRAALASEDPGAVAGRHALEQALDALDAALEPAR